MDIAVEKLLAVYYKWLKDKTVWTELKDEIKVTTPYLDRHNDYVQLYIKKDNHDYILTDDGYTIDDLEFSGCSIDSPKRQKLLEVTLKGFGVQRSGRQLLVKTTEKDFAINKHNLVQAILSVNDMFYLAKANVANIFSEDVKEWLDSCNIRFSERITFIGHSGYNRHFNFVIPKSKNAPERMIQTVNNPTKNTAEIISFGWLDTKKVRADDSKAYAFINDNDREVPDSFKSALSNYDVKPILWREKDEFKEELAA